MVAENDGGCLHTAALSLLEYVFPKVPDADSWPASSRALLAPNSIAVSIKAVDVASDDNYRALHIGRTISATASAVDITGDRDAGTGVVRVTR